MKTNKKFRNRLIVAGALVVAGAVGAVAYNWQQPVNADSLPQGTYIVSINSPDPLATYVNGDPLDFNITVTDSSVVCKVDEAHSDMIFLHDMAGSGTTRTYSTTFDRLGYYAIMCSGSLGYEQQLWTSPSQNQAPSDPLGTAKWNCDSSITVNWTASIDPDGSVVKYVIAWDNSGAVSSTDSRAELSTSTLSYTIPASKIKPYTGGTDIYVYVWSVDNESASGGSYVNLTYQNTNTCPVNPGIGIPDTGLWVNKK